MPGASNDSIYVKKHSLSLTGLFKPNQTELFPFKQLQKSPVEA